MLNFHRPQRKSSGFWILDFGFSTLINPKSKIQNPKSYHWLVVLLLITSMLAGGCSLSNLPTARRTPDANVAQSAQASPTAVPTPLSQSEQLDSRLTPLIR